MLKKLLLLTLLTLSFSSFSQAREGTSIGIIGNGNFFLTDANPNLEIGPGGGLFIDWRFNQRWGLETDFWFSVHNGRKASNGDDSQYLIGVPNANLKFYFLKEETRFDPYASVGIGIYALTEGSVSNNSGGAGVGAQVGLGTDFYLSEKLSLGVSAQFRSIALIQGQSRSAALINFGLQGQFAYHF